MSAPVKLTVPSGAEPAFAGDNDAPAVMIGSLIRRIKADGSLADEKPVSFSDSKADWSEVKKRFAQLTGGLELVLSQ